MRHRIVVILMWRDAKKRGAAWRDEEWRGVTRRGAARCGVTRRDVNRCGVTRRDVAWFGVAWRDEAWRGVAWRDATWRDATRRGVAWRDFLALVITLMHCESYWIVIIVNVVVVKYQWLNSDMFQYVADLIILQWLIFRLKWYRTSWKWKWLFQRVK